MIMCPCGSQESYARCCEPFLSNQTEPITPEALMRSRYAAYCLARIDYIKRTMRGKALLYFDERKAEAWAKRVSWLGLKVLQAEFNSPGQGYVEFIAEYIDGSVFYIMHEKSEFIREDGRWYYVDGVHGSKTGKQILKRNSACPCKSLKKFKNCHGKG